ncbi:hypothetical protein THAOC_25524 [Thalassiosira oceanica]|uniref:Uncharacterized protein n=1 Tax=Thalassiosira oceanica TaxID=159749 RepID=K0S7M5_THAOC|nr:hypothetical protein THAOC_25524 [Thalassiosira oceanica]|eukprot:EJK54817.1 hypothetical protein THAOC_25524 [Thalassiosira oceanica]
MTNHRSRAAGALQPPSAQREVGDQLPAARGFPSVDEPLQQSRAQPAVVARAAPRPCGVLRVRPPPPPRLSSLSGPFAGRPSPRRGRLARTSGCPPDCKYTPKRTAGLARVDAPIRVDGACLFLRGRESVPKRPALRGPRRIPCRGGVPRPGERQGRGGGQPEGLSGRRGCARANQGPCGILDGGTRRQVGRMRVGGLGTAPSWESWMG